MNRLDPLNCTVWGAIAAFVVSFLVVFAIYGVPAFRHFFDAATAYPTACADLNASDCAARAEWGW